MSNRYFIVFFKGIRRVNEKNSSFDCIDGFVTHNNEMLFLHSTVSELSKMHNFSKVSIKNFKEMSREDYKGFLNLDDSEVKAEPPVDISLDVPVLPLTK